LRMSKVTTLGNDPYASAATAGGAIPNELLDIAPHACTPMFVKTQMSERWNRDC
jgi:hypothetical protein